MPHRIKHVTIIMVTLLGLNLYPQQIPNLVPILEVEGENEGDKLGLAVKGAGDLNGDGFDDFLVSVGSKDSTYLYFGGNPIDTIPEEAFFPDLIRIADDFNGDGYMDLGILEHIPYEPGRIFIYMGGEYIDTLPDIVIPPDSAGTAAIDHRWATGDLNNDANGDFVFTDFNYNSMRGKIYVYLGQDTLDIVPSFTLEGTVGAEGLGLGCAIGDINADGIDDLIIGGYDQSEPAPDRYHYLKIFFGKQDFDLDSCFYIDEREIGNSFGFSTGIQLESFDVNSDQIDDIVVRGREVFFGDTSFNPTAVDMYYEPIPGTTGRSIPEEAGDINNDGKPDLLVSDPSLGSGSGVIAIYHGGSAEDTTIDGIYSLGFNISGFGSSISTAGKVDGTDRDRIIVGAPGFEFEENRGFFGIYGDTTTLTIDSRHQQIPRLFKLHQNYPNPFNPETTIRFYIPYDSKVELHIYNFIGQKVCTLINSKMKKGKHGIIWNGRDNSGNRVSSGIYLYVLSAGNRTEVKKMLMLK
ncbi:MAG: T9SS type A sorting domain-containing protein [Candidatus Marinimicrobia bacterium]|nr:T9SS type A sorting domain-containing protein [Candidatus Neomarinimicrobiota bacterium]